jgi:hypothetical protein
MRDGIYHVRFVASSTDMGEGLVVIKQGTMNGGDQGYLYTGQLAANGTSITGKLRVKKWHAGAVSVFGPLDDFELQLTGNDTPDGGFRASGVVADPRGMTIVIEGRYLSAAA